ncbi:M20 family metallo-hydrolase [Aureibacter tunicatorum]|uniref:Acetylornithine deacetylase n=1 Tax=Aureibacter tunicatorum TaxID=866807 RepID=A0AAE3XKY3_9BACT|nr:M20 family metallo-hydrolase [Aureibacter tunicatorum]MDR6239751.1 acetylornithine deacetylase [Aureibacter tunicatorum]BDD04227.1 acetylornithine deacetylase [Aureibacter tunicatorum]
MDKDNFLTKEAVNLLKSMIAIASYSGDEHRVADLIKNILETSNIEYKSQGNNVWAHNKHFTQGKPTILLNSHIDTVKPSKSWTKDPFTPIIESGKLYGLGSNDAGASLVSLLAAFKYFHHDDELNFNLIFAATAEEEVSGPNGIASIIEQLGAIDFAIVGEPTKMNLAIAEKGLMVIDGEAKGISGHAAREEGENAIYKALKDIGWLQNYSFDKESNLLGPVKMSVTQINAGSQHNVVPDRCGFVIDVRSNEHYSNREIFEMLQKNTLSELKARSFRLNSSGMSANHPFAKKAISLGLETFGSPTLSDQALIPFVSAKIGPGDSARSHTADEYIHLSEIEKGIDTYINLLKDFKL